MDQAWEAIIFGLFLIDSLGTIVMAWFGQKCGLRQQDRIQSIFRLPRVGRCCISC